jgi:hypothetical protein
MKFCTWCEFFIKCLLSDWYREPAIPDIRSVILLAFPTSTENAMPVWSYSVFDFVPQRLIIRQLICADTSWLKSGLSLISLWANVGGEVRHSQFPYKSVVKQRRTGFHSDDIKFRDVNILTILTKCFTVCCRKSHCWQQCPWNCDAPTLPPIAAWYTNKH